MDPGLRFWMSCVDARGGLTERSGESTLVVLPPDVAGEFDLPDEFMVTGEPDVAREDGAVLLATGHPVLIQAADAALSHGDVGVVALAPPTTPAPDGAQLEQRVRDQVQVEHGKIEVTGLPTRIDRPVLRLGALVTYSLSADEHYQERLECWIDAGSGRQLAPDVVARLRAAPRAERATRARPRVLEAVSADVGRAHAILDAAAERRRTALSGQASDAHRRERAHAIAYYADVLRSLERRRAGADPDRAELLAARAASTREERSRRLLEIDEKYQARHEIRPFRLHAVLVPGWRVPVDVRRGPRRYPFAFDWLAALGAFAEERCPHCGAAATLSASKIRLGCIDCLASAGAASA
jgi:hypothetical protein